MEKTKQKQKQKKTKNKKKTWHILWLAPTDAKGMHEAKIVHAKKAYTTRQDIYL